jgi:hypothetical protein
MLKYTALAACAALALAGCSTPPGGGAPVVSPQVTTIEQEAFNYVCPVITLVGPFVSLAGPEGAGAYAIVSQLCSAGVIATAGQFLTEFEVIEPAVVAYFESLGTKAGKLKAAHVRALHREALKYHVG